MITITDSIRSKQTTHTLQTRRWAPLGVSLRRAEHARKPRFSNCTTSDWDLNPSWDLNPWSSNWDPTWSWDLMRLRFFFSTFNWRIIALQYHVGFCPYNNLNQSKVYICSLPLQPLSHPLPHPTPLDCHRAQSWKLRFLMSHWRQNSMRDKVIGNKWIYLERTHSTDRVWCISEGKRNTRVWGCQFSRVEWFHRLMSWGIWGKGWGFPGIGPPPTFWPFWWALELSWPLWKWKC